MRFTPLSDKELAEMNMIPEGYYRYKVLESQDRRSQKGADMIEMKVEIYCDGGKRVLFDYLHEAMMHKINHFCKVNDMMDKYDQGTLTSPDCRGKSGGFVHIVKQKDKTGQYPDKSVIKDYVLEKVETAKVEPVGLGVHDKLFDDDLPPF